MLGLEVCATIPGQVNVFSMFVRFVLSSVFLHVNTPLFEHVLKRQSSLYCLFSFVSGDCVYADLVSRALFSFIAMSVCSLVNVNLFCFLKWVLKLDSVGPPTWFFSFNIVLVILVLLPLCKLWNLFVDIQKAHHWALNGTDRFVKLILCLLCRKKSYSPWPVWSLAQLPIGRNRLRRLTRN